MSEQIPETDAESEERYIKTFGIGERPASEICLNFGNAQLQIRQEGAMICAFSFDGVPILTSPIESLQSYLDAENNPAPDFVQPAKPDAAHTMLPVSKSDFAPQHGTSRYGDYKIESSQPNKVCLSYTDRLYNLGHLKTFEIIPRSLDEHGGLVVVDEVMNLSDKEQGVSVGEHYYFACPEDEIADIELIDVGGQHRPIRAMYRDGHEVEGTMADFWPALQQEQGEAFYTNLPGGNQEIRFADGRVVGLKAAAKMLPGRHVDLMIWHRKDADTICFEPVCGTQRTAAGVFHNQEIILKPGESLKFTTGIDVLRV